MKLCILGAGNVATHLATAFVGVGHDVTVWNRNEAGLDMVNSLHNCHSTTRLDFLPKDADVYLISVRDDALNDIAEALRGVLGRTDAIIAHTAGSVALHVLETRFTHCGVLYPMQTFSKTKPLDYSAIPFFIEGKGGAERVLWRLAESVSANVYVADSHQRKTLHIASVFACNFVNHCFAISERILSEANVPFRVMLPLIQETIAKVQIMSPSQGQTGPAVREDHTIMDEHIRMLCDKPIEQEIYKLLSQNIINYK